MPSTKIACTKMLGFSKYSMSYLSFTLLLSQYVLDSLSGVPQVQNCLFFLAITVGGATKGCATKLGNSRATNRIYLLNNNKYTQKQKGNRSGCLILYCFCAFNSRYLWGLYSFAILSAPNPSYLSNALAM